MASGSGIFLFIFSKQRKLGRLESKRIKASLDINTPICFWNLKYSGRVFPDVLKMRQKVDPWNPLPSPSPDHISIKTKWDIILKIYAIIFFCTRFWSRDLWLVLGRPYPWCLALLQFPCHTSTVCFCNRRINVINGFFAVFLVRAITFEGWGLYIIGLFSSLGDVFWRSWSYSKTQRERRSE